VRVLSLLLFKYFLLNLSETNKRKKKKPVHEPGAAAA
jgi:hypothetical protein